MSVYNDLWRSKSDRIQAEKDGIANENLRKLFSKDNSGVNDGDSLMFSIHDTKHNIQLSGSSKTVVYTLRSKATTT